LRTLERLGELGVSSGVQFCVENLNTIVDHPGVPLARAKDTLALIEGVGHPNVKMMLDLYHAQIGEGNLIELVRRCGDAIGEIQVADVPGRCQPGTGEIYYPAVAKALHDMGYRGTVSLEGYAEGDDVAALEAFRAAFTVWPFSGRRACHGLTGVRTTSCATRTEDCSLAAWVIWNSLVRQRRN
jgi:hydroxypyruvate isomerase